MRRFEFGEIKVTWIELFFDLVFVATAHEIATILKSVTSLLEALPYLALFLLILWMWLSHTLFSARFESRGLFYHIGTFLIMCCVFGLIVMLPAIQDNIVWFAVLYATARGILLIMYIGNLLTRWMKILHLLPMLIGFSCAAVLWALSPLTPYPYAFWVAAFLIEFLSPIFSRKLLKNVHIHTTHLPERLGLLTVIMLGEMIISMVASAHDISLTQDAVLTLGAGMLTIGAIFWTYFRYIENNIIGQDGVASNLYVYAHLPLFIALVCFAAGFKASLVEAHVAWLVIIGIVLYVVSFRAIKYVTEEYIPIRQLVSFCIYGGITLVYMVFSTPGLMQIAIMVSLFIVYLILTEIFLTIFKENKRSSPQTGFSWDD